MTRRFLFIGAWCCVAGLCFFLLIAPEFLQVLPTPIIGLVAAPRRLLAHWQPTPPGLVLFGLGLAILVGGTHAFLSWIHAAKAKELPGEAEPAKPWQLAHTLCGFGLLFLTLLAVGSAVLIAHQTYWLRHTSEPWFVRANHQRAQRILMQADLQALLLEYEWATAPVRDGIQGFRLTRSGQALWEDYQPLLVEQSPGKLKVVFMVPRKAAGAAKAEVLCLRSGESAVWHPLHKLPDLLVSAGITEHNAADHLKPQPVGQ